MTQISTYLKHTLPETLLFVLSVCLLSLSNVTALTGLLNGHKLY